MCSVLFPILFSSIFLLVLICLGSTIACTRIVNIAGPCSIDMGEFNDGWISCEGSSGLGMRVTEVERG